MSQATAFEQFQQFLWEMFQYDNNDLDFGLFKVLRLKRSYIEQFINGAGEQDLKQIVQRELAAIRSTESEDEGELLGHYLDGLGQKTKNAWAALRPEANDPENQARLKKAVEALEEEDKLAATQQRLDRWLATQRLSISHLEAQLYNYLLNFFELYYQNGDFGYNSRASSAFKVPYEADYDGSDTLFHWKHKDSYYIKTGASFPEVKLDVLGQKIVFRLQAGGEEGAESTAQNNNKESDIKHYRLAGIAQEPAADDSFAWVLRFTLAGASTPKAEIYPQLWQAALASVAHAPADIAAYLFEGTENKPIFNDLGKDHDKAEGGQIKGINQLRLNQDKYLETLAKNPVFRALGNNAESRVEALRKDPAAQAVYAIDKALNRFYVGQDADYFIHKDLYGFLTREKDRFIKNVIFSDLETLLARQTDPATLIIARGFNAVAARIIEFLDVLETFQRNLFTLKKKVVDTHWLISVGKIDAAFYPRLIANPHLLAYWASEFKCSASNAEEVAAHPTLVVDTSLFASAAERQLIDEIIGSFDRLDEQTDGLLIHSENWQALNLLQDKFRERIQCIYIDPPYNTGGDGFLYKDSFRHSSWASMMSQGMGVAGALLSTEGVMFSSIDENEKQSLKCVARDNFSGLPVHELIRTTGTPTAQGTTGLSNTYDSLLLMCKVERAHLYGLPLTEDDKRIYNQEDSKGRYLTRLLRMTGEEDRREDRPDMYYGVLNPDGANVFPTGPGGYESRWRLRKTEYDNRLQEGRIEWKLTTSPDDEDEEQDEEIPRWKPYLKFHIPLTKTVQNLWNDIEGNKKGKRDLKNVVGQVKGLTPKPIGLICRIIEASTLPGDTILDYFGGTATTACAVMRLNSANESPRRKWVICDSGEVIKIARARIERLMFTVNWKAGSPIQSNEKGMIGIVKVQRLEQYEDVIANLDTAWNETTLPEGIPVSYLFRPEQNRIQLTLNLKRPFDNRIGVGRAREKQPIDLLESWAYLHGYWQRSRRVFSEDGRRYECLETECGTLVVLRDICEPEDDSAALKAIAERYVDSDEDGKSTSRLRRLEVNYWANLKLVEAALPGLPCSIINAQDFDRGAEWV
ncbi:site-specific DNA-methyltransferase [Propionivibrio sp.]|uniref:site-specific DNA-methyltransferase n=1 Tax=Propionivibrio sp. TaxID=2212460 RepID=UPI003BF0EA7B